MQSYLDPLKCEWCAKHLERFVPPQIQSRPQVVLVGEAPGRTELQDGRPFVGDSGKLLRGILHKLQIKAAIFVNSRNTFDEAKPATEAINACRTAHLLPVLEAYPGVPVVSLGQYAAQAILGGKRSDTSMAGGAFWLYDRNVLFTYHPAYYLHANRDERILKHIEAHIASAVAKPANTGQELDDVLPDISASHSVVIDIEASTDDLPFYGSQITIFGLRPVPGNVSWLLTQKWLSVKKNLSQLIAWLRDAKVIVGHGMIFDLLHLGAIGIDLADRQLFDTLIYEKNLGYESFGGYGLKYLAKHYFSAPPWEAKFRTALKQEGPVSLDATIEENVGDLYYTAKLYEQDKADLPMFNLDMDYLSYLVRMVRNGIKINTQTLRKLKAYYENLRTRKEREGRKLLSLGKDFNYNSWQQVLPVLKRHVSASIPNTCKATLIEYADKNKFVPVLLDIHAHTKTIGMLADIESHIVKPGGLVHAKAQEHGAETSRTTTKGPNIQNWPEKIRKILVSRYKGGKILHPDLSQLEYRLIAHETGETRLIRAFKNSEDIHSNLYKEIFGEPPPNAKRRKLAKTIRYMKVYGGGFKKFKYLSELPAKEAREIFYERLENVDTAVDDYKEDLLDRLESGGNVRIYNLFGRFRDFDVRFFQDSQAALREAFNWIFQSSGHDILKLWTMESLDLIDDPEVLFIDDAHDEFVLDCPGKKVKAAVEAIKFTSANLNELIREAFGVRMRVPITAEIEVGKEWA